MVRIHTKGDYIDGKCLADVYCLSTDDKPTDGMATGSLSLEVDTGDVYAYDETSETWTKQFSLQD